MKDNHYIIMCRTLTNAQRISAMFERSGISASIFRAPASISNDGCSYSVRVSERYFAYARDILKSTSIRYGKIYSYSSDGTYLEVS